MTPVQNVLNVTIFWHIVSKFHEIKNSFKSSHFFPQTEKNLTDEEAGIGLRLFNSDVPIIDQRCPWTPEPQCTDKQVTISCTQKDQKS